MQRFRRSRSESKKRRELEKSSSLNPESSTETRRRGSSSTSTTNTPSANTSRRGSSVSSSAGKDAEDGEERMMIRSTSNSSSLLLPEPEEFRTSLILPHLTARFELLRGTDGQLVDYETLTTHLDEQRKTGRLTTFEMDAVLQQYKLQSQFEANQHPLPTSSSMRQPPPVIKRKRIDWSGIDLEKMARESGPNSGGGGGVPQVSISTSPDLNPNPNSNKLLLSPSMSSSNGSPTSSRTSFVSFLPSPVVSNSNGTFLPQSFSPTATTTTSSIVSHPTIGSYPLMTNPSSSSSTTSSSHSYSTGSSPPLHPHQQQRPPPLIDPRAEYMSQRRAGGGGGGGGGLFGGRVGGSKEMVKSQSQGSITSLSSSRRRARTIDSQSQSREEREELKGKGKGKEIEIEGPGDDVEIGQREGKGEGVGDEIPNLTQSQIKRISRVLETIQDELGRTLANGLRGKSSSPRLNRNGGNGRESLSEGEGIEEAEEEENLQARFRDQDESDLEEEERVDREGGNRTPSSTQFLSPLPTSFSGLSTLGPVSPASPVNHEDLKGKRTFDIDDTEEVEGEEGRDREGETFGKRRPMSDTEPIDPFYSRHRTTNDPPPRQLETLERASQVPLPSSSSISSSLDSHAHSHSNEDDHPSPLPATVSSNSILSIDSQSQRQRQYTSETDTTETPSTPNGTVVPKAFSFPFVPSREVDEGGEREENLDEDADEVEDHEGDVTAIAASIPLPSSGSTSSFDLLQGRGSHGRDSSLFSASYRDSTGSSFHEAMETVGSSDTLSNRGERIAVEEREQELSEDELELSDDKDYRESRLLDELPPPLPRSALVPPETTPSYLPRSKPSGSISSLPTTLNGRPESQPIPPLSELDRLPSSELLALAGDGTMKGRGARGGGEDLVLEDLVVIQETLVRRAEEKRRLETIAAMEEETGEVVDAEGAQEGEGGHRNFVRIEEVLNGDEDGPDEGAVESIRDVELVGRGESEEEQLETRTDEEDVEEGDGIDSDDASSSMGTGMGSRKDSAESGITSTGAFDFGDELAGLGFGSFSPSSAASRRASKRRESTRSTNTTATSSNFPGGSGKGISSMLLGPQSSKMELQTSQSSSSPAFTNTAITPSTTRSDAFEFSSLTGSPTDAAFWSDQRETSREYDRPDEEDEEEEPFSPELGVSRSPGMQNLSIEHAKEADVLEEDETDLAAQHDDEEGETEDQVADLPAPASEVTESTPSESAPALGAPVELDTAQPLLRVPRNMPRRDPASTTSMLIRDVRNQATLATFALKKTPTSPPSRSLSKKSIRKGSISSPHLVSGPIDMATVPIVPSSSSILVNGSPSSVSPRANSKVSRSKTRRDKDNDAEGSKSKGLGLRFKMLLKKQSRDHLSLNGDEVTPFVDFSTAEPRGSTSGPPPVTPPNQDTARFASPGSANGSDFPQTPNDDPTTPLAKPHPTSAVRSPPRRPPPPSLEAVEELAERSSPPISVVSDSNPRYTYPASPALSNLSGKEGRGLNRFVSRLRKSPVPPAARPNVGSQESSQTSAKTSFDEAASVASSREAEGEFGLGIANNGERPSLEEPAQRSKSNDSYPVVASTAPLSVGRNSQASLAMQSGFSFPPDSSIGIRSSRPSGSITRTSGHPVRASSDSMQRLWEAAEDLGLPPDKVQELVDSAYAQSPTTSHGHSGSMSSSLGNRSISTNSPRRQHSNASHHRRGGSISSQTRHTSEASSSAGYGHGRKGSTSSSRSLQDRAPTPPPGSRHRRKASLASSREAGLPPELPTSYTANSLPPSSSANSRLSVSGSQYPPPASPSLGSIISSRRSGYADSFLDFYAQASDDYDEQDVPPVPPLSRQHTSDRSLAANSDGCGDQTLQPEDGEERDEPGGEVVWQVLSDLRNNRLSTLSKDSSFGFDSRDSSFEVEHGASEGGPSDRSESIANMLRHRDRKRSSVTMPPFQAGRFPSIYVRDEQKLLDLGQHGGVAQEQQGHFFVRPKDSGDGSQDAQQAPPLPDEYQQLIASASSRHGVPAQYHPEQASPNYPHFTNPSRPHS